MPYHDEEDDRHGTKFYGTPFPALRDDEAPSKKPDIDLTVRDEQGRRRFHGAFTGGFSAGHWNTVGSKEGWVPSQFVSGRKEKWDRNLLKGKPEDFMDEEDFMVHGIAPKSVHTTELFSSDPMSDFVSGRPAASAIASSSLTGESDLVDFLKKTVRPAKMSIGVQILKKMKAGSKSLNESKDRIAAAVSSRKKKQKEKKSASEDGTSGSSSRLYGCSLPPGFAHFDDSSEEEEEEQKEEEEEIDDTENSFASYKLPFARKCNHHGLGYRGMLQPSASSSSTPSSATAATSMSLTANVAGKKLHISGDAFGIGVLDEENDAFDDVTLYEKEDMSIYDFEMRGERKKKNKSLRPTLCDYGNRSLEDLFVKESSRTSSASKFQSLARKYPPPEIPADWRPAVRFPGHEKERMRAGQQQEDRMNKDVRSNDRDDEFGKRKKSRWDVRTGEEDEHKKSSSSKSAAASAPSSSRSIPGRVMDANVRSLLLGEGIKLGVHRQSVTGDQDVRERVKKEKGEEVEKEERASGLNQGCRRNTPPVNAQHDTADSFIWILCK